MVAGLIALVLLVLLFSPLRLEVIFSGGVFIINARYFFIKMPLVPAMPPKAGKKKKPKKEKAKKEKPLEKEPAKKSAKYWWAVIKACRGALDTLRNHLVFYRIRLSVIAGGGDAHTSAMRYAQICALVANTLAVFDSLFVLQEPQSIAVRPDFANGKTDIDLWFRIKIAPFYIISAGIQVLFALVTARPAVKKHRRKKNRSKQKAQSVQ